MDKEFLEHFKTDVFIAKVDHVFVHPMCTPYIRVIGNSELFQCPCGEIWRLYLIDVLNGNQTWMNYIDNEMDKKSRKDENKDSPL